LKLSNTSTSLGNGAFSVGLNTISIGCNADTIDAVPFEQDMEITDGKLTINTIRQSGEGDYCLMYDPTSVPKELTYSRYIPDHFDQIDVSLNVHDVSLNGLDISVNIIDVSLNVHDVSLNIHDVSLNIHDVSLNVHDVSLNGLDISVNIIDVSLNIHDVSLNGLDISVNIIDVSLNIHDVSLNVLDVSLNIIDVSLNDFMNSAGAGSTFAIGAGSSATGTNSFAIGNNATTLDHDNAVAIGNGSSVGASNVICLGDGTQNVGIGTTSPSEVLEISGNVFVNSPDDLVGLSISAGQSSSSGSQSSYLELIRYDDAQDNNGRNNWKLLNDGSTAGNFHLQRQQGATGTYTSYMTVKGNNGRVGIGTTTPTEALDVNGNIIFSSVGPKYIRGGSDILTLESEYALKIKSDWNNNNSANPADIIFYTGASERMRIKRDTGRVGIGTTSPSYPFHVSNTAFGNGNNLSSTGFLFGDAAWNYTNGTHTIQGYVRRFGTEVIIFESDRRIKTEIVDIEDDAALVTFRNLKPRKYKYIDFRERTSNTVYGFIAQEVKEVLPNSTGLDSKIIPNIYELANIMDGVITLTDNTTIDLSLNDTIRLITETEDIESTVAEIIDNKKFKVEKNIENGPLFVYGTKIDDFHTLDKNAIFTVATAALQEVDRQQQADKQRIAELETKNTALETKNTALETQMASVLARLDALENP